MQTLWQTVPEDHAEDLRHVIFQLLNADRGGANIKSAVHVFLNELLPKHYVLFLV